jgi:hypothetical protein
MLLAIQNLIRIPFFNTNVQQIQKFLFNLTINNFNKYRILLLLF